MLSDTLSEGLKAYHIGSTLRALRLKKKLGLVELGQHTGLSPAMLSKIEREKLFPTLPTLLRIALVFGVGLDYFFGRDRARPALAVVRASERKRFPDRPESPQPAYHFECLDYPVTERRLNAYYAEFSPVDDDVSEVHTHEGAEVVFVVEGRLAIVVGEQEYVLAAGDSIYFDPAPPHRYRRLGARRCTAVVVTTAATT